MKLCVIILVGLILRIIAAYIIPDQTYLLGDISDYRDIARQFLTHGTMVNVYRMPFYPWQIALTNQLTSDIIISLGMIVAVYLLVKDLFSETTALIAATITACYPPLIFFSVVGLPENTFITAIIFSFVFWYRGKFAIASIFAVIAILTRPIFDLFAPVLTVIFSVIHGLTFKQTMQKVLLYFAIYILMMTPWWINNYIGYGSFVRLTLGSGEVLYAGNNPLNKSGGGNLGTDFNLDQFKTITNPVERDKAERNAAIEFIYSNPLTFLELAVLKLERFWRPWPINDGYKSSAWLAGLSYIPILILSIIGLFYCPRQKISPILLFGLGYTLIHVVLVGTIRYRLPLEPFMIIFASYAISRMLGIYNG